MGLQCRSALINHQETPVKVCSLEGLQSRARASNLSSPAVAIPTYESVGNWAPLDVAFKEPLAVGSALFFTALGRSFSHFPLHWVNPSRALEKTFQSDSMCLGLKSQCLQLEVAPSTVMLLSISGPCLHHSALSLRPGTHQRFKNQSQQLLRQPWDLVASHLWF